MDEIIHKYELPECELFVIEKEDYLHFGTYLNDMQCEDTENKLSYKNLKYVDNLNKGVDELIKKYEEIYENSKLSLFENSHRYGIFLRDLKKLKGE